jgi:hypothetical protein
MRRLKIILLISVIFLLSVLLFSCTGSKAGINAISTDELIAMLPYNVKTIGYADYQSIYNTDEFRNVIQKGDMPYVEEMLKPFAEFVIGVGKVNPDKISRTKDVVVLMSGEYSKETISQIAQENFKFDETMTINSVESITNGDWSFIFVADNLLALSRNGYENEVINSTKYNKNTIDKNSVLYKSAIEMEKTNIGWTVSNFEYIGDIFDGLNIPGMKQKMYISITKLIISQTKDDVKFEIVLEDLNSSGIGIMKSMLQLVKPILYMFLRPELNKLLTNEQMNEIDKVYNNISIDTVGNSIKVNAVLSVYTVSALWRNYETLVRIFSN